MGKSKSRNSSSRNSRDVNNRIASPRLAFRPLIRPITLNLSEDRRVFHPDRRMQNARSYKSSSHRLEVPNQYRNPFSPHVAFTAPRSVFICVRRKIRREVIFAKGGGGRRKMRHPRRSYYSDVRC